MPEVIRNCDECSLLAHSPGDQQWVCNHPRFRKSGKYVSVTMLDGRPFKTGVSKQCPLREGDLHLVLADDVMFF